MDTLYHLPHAQVRIMYLEGQVYTVLHQSLGDALQHGKDTFCMW